MMTCRLLDSWPRIKSVRLDSVSLSLGRPDDARDSLVCPPQCCLETLDLAGDVWLPPCLTPATLTSVRLDSQNMFLMPPDCDWIIKDLEPVRSQLRELAILDTLPPGDDSPNPGGERGGLDALFVGMDKLERLEISPSTVTDLGAALSGLPVLAVLAIVQGCRLQGDWLGVDEVVAYLASQSGLRSLSVDRLIWGRWTAEDRSRAHQTAHKKRVKMVFLD